MQNLKHWAHWYIDQNCNIFPLMPKDKRPHFQLLAETGFTTDKIDGSTVGSWKPLQDLRVSHGLVDAWWGKEPNANIALICGKSSNITVIDIDVDKTGKGEQPQSITDAFNLSTPTSITGSGGMHLFCSYYSQLKNSVGKAHPQIDIRNDGGYIVLPPSIHPNGNPYQWVDPEAIIDWTLADFPLTLANLLSADNDANDIKTRKATWYRIVNGLREGTDGRHNGAAKIIGAFLSKYEALLYPESTDQVELYLSTLWDFLVFWNKRNSPPLSEQELQTVFKSISSKVMTF